jgi:hypothetical protein
MKNYVFILLVSERGSDTSLSILPPNRLSRLNRFFHLFNLLGISLLPRQRRGIFNRSHLGKEDHLSYGVGIG